MLRWAREQVAAIAGRGLGLVPVRARHLEADRGAVGLEMGIMLIAPVVVAATVGASLMRVGSVASRDVQSSVLDAMQQVGSGIQATGPVFARTDGTRTTHLLVDVTTTPGSPPERLDPHATIDRLTVSYVDSETIQRDVPYAVTWISGNGDDLLERGEVAQIDIDMSGVRSRERFTIEIRPPAGAYASLEIQLPARSSLPPILRLD